MPEMLISYTPRVLRTMDEICRKMGVGPSTVKKWMKDGAPIAFELGAHSKRGRYSAELGALQQWRVNHSRPV